MTSTPSNPVAQKMKPGNGGVLQYELMSSKRVKIILAKVECTKCTAEYHWVASTSLQATYAGTVCPTSLFENFLSESKSTVDSNRLSGWVNNENEIEFDYELKNEVEYIGVKAVIGEKEVYYEPIELRTMWASISSPSTNDFSWVYVGALSVCALMIAVRRKMRRADYQAISSSVDL